MDFKMEASERAKSLSPSKTLAVDAKAKALKADGADVINFAAGEPDFDTPEHIKAAAMAFLDAGFTKYTPASGIPELREAISEKLKEDNDLNYDPSQIVVTSGAKQACFHAMLAALDPGDEVLIPAPYWTSYPEMVKLANCEPEIVQTTRETNYKLTADQFLESLSPKTKMIVLNSPSNPTGAIYTPNELAAIVEVALDEEIYILSDEIYEKLIYDAVEYVSPASLSGDVYDLTITVNGFSKAYSMTGWRLGYVAGPEAMKDALNSIQSHASSNATSFAQKGALAALKSDQECIESMVGEYTRRRNRMMELLDGVRQLEYFKPEGAFYMFVDISRTGKKSGEFAEELLDEEQVAVVPGEAFGDDDAIRLSYATSMEEIEEGMKRITRYILG